MMQMKLLKDRHRLTDLENELIVAEGKRWEEQRREFGTDVYTLLHLKWKTNKGQRTLPNVMWQPRWEGVWEEQIHVYMQPSPFAIHLKLSQHCQLAILQYEIKSFFKKRKKYMKGCD